MVKKMLKNQKGLTLIELLAVIVILGIIAAIAVPSIMGIIDKSRTDAARGDALQVLNAAKLYVAAAAPEGTITFTDDGDNTELNDYLENVGDYTITVSDSTGDYVYSAIEVTKNDVTVKYATQQDLLDNVAATQ